MDKSSTAIHSLAETKETKGKVGPNSRITAIIVNRRSSNTLIENFKKGYGSRPLHEDQEEAEAMKRRTAMSKETNNIYIYIYIRIPAKHLCSSAYLGRNEINLLLLLLDL